MLYDLLSILFHKFSQKHHSHPDHLLWTMDFLPLGVLILFPQNSSSPLDSMKAAPSVASEFHKPKCYYQLSLSIQVTSLGYSSLWYYYYYLQQTYSLLPQQKEVLLHCCYYHPHNSKIQRLFFFHQEILHTCQFFFILILIEQMSSLLLEWIMLNLRLLHCCHFFLHPHKS